MNRLRPSVVGLDPGTAGSLGTGAVRGCPSRHAGARRPGGRGRCPVARSIARGGRAEVCRQASRFTPGKRAARRQPTTARRNAVGFGFGPDALLDRYTGDVSGGEQEQQPCDGVADHHGKQWQLGDECPPRWKQSNRAVVCRDDAQDVADDDRSDLQARHRASADWRATGSRPRYPARTSSRRCPTGRPVAPGCADPRGRTASGRWAIT